MPSASLYASIAALLQLAMLTGNRAHLMSNAISCTLVTVHVAAVAGFQTAGALTLYASQCRALPFTSGQYLPPAPQGFEASLCAGGPCIRIYKHGKAVGEAMNGSANAIQSLLAKHVLSK